MAEVSSASGGEERSADSPSDPNAISSVPGEAQAEFAAEHQPRRFKLWMVLVPVLVLVIALLASDIVRGRMPQEAAYEQVNAKLPVDQTSDSQALGLGGSRQADSKPAIVSPDTIHQLLGANPIQLKNDKSKTMNNSCRPWSKLTNFRASSKTTTSS